MVNYHWQKNWQVEAQNKENHLKHMDTYTTQTNIWWTMNKKKRLEEKCEQHLGRLQLHVEKVSDKENVMFQMETPNWHIE